MCLFIAVCPPSFCFTWKEIEEIINTMWRKSLVIQTCDSTLNAKIATAIILLIEYRDYTYIKRPTVSLSGLLVFP